MVKGCHVAWRGTVLSVNISLSICPSKLWVFSSRFPWKPSVPGRSSQFSPADFWCCKTASIHCWNWCCLLDYPYGFQHLVVPSPKKTKWTYQYLRRYQKRYFVVPCFVNFWIYSLFQSVRHYNSKWKYRYLLGETPFWNIPWIRVFPQSTPWRRQLFYYVGHALGTEQITNMILACYVHSLQIFHQSVF